MQINILFRMAPQGLRLTMAGFGFLALRKRSECGLVSPTAAVVDILVDAELFQTSCQILPRFDGEYHGGLRVSAL